MIIRELKRPEEFEEAVRVQVSAWRMSDEREAVPAHMLKAVADNGGVVLGAFDDSGRLVGFCFGFPGKGEYGEYLYSHMTGVVEEAKYRGVGYELKKAQREWAIAHGYKLIVWTYDPLQGLNSYFNMVKLGVIVRRYYENYYGEIRDGINRGMPSDRVKAEWWILSPRVESILRRSFSHHVGGLLDVDSYYLLRVDNDYKPYIVSTSPSSHIAFIEIPLTVEDIRRRHGVRGLIEWRNAMRETMARLLNDYGYVAVYFYRDRARGKGVYLLVKRSLSEIIGSTSIEALV